RPPGRDGAGSAPRGAGPRSYGDNLAEQDAPHGDPQLGPVLLPDEVGLRFLVPPFEDPDRLGQISVRQFELEGHALAEILGCHKVLSLHEVRSLANEPGPGGRYSRSTASAASRNSCWRPVS